MKGSQVPKQFLEVKNKPILVYTLEKFQNNKDIDKIFISCVEDWIDYAKELVLKYQLTKVISIVKGGTTGQLSIYNGLKEAEKYMESNEDIVLIHDGVRPMITDSLISENVSVTKEHGSCITCTNVIETIVKGGEEGKIENVFERDALYVAKAPQSFLLKEILKAQEKEVSKGNINAIDSCTLMSKYGYPLYRIQGEQDNLKITTPIDYVMFKALIEAQQEGDWDE